MGTGTTGSISAAEEDEGVHYAKSASLTISHTEYDESEAEGESLDNKLTTMFTLIPSEIRPFIKGQLGYQDFDFSRPKRCSIV